MVQGKEHVASGSRLALTQSEVERMAEIIS